MGNYTELKFSGLIKKDLIEDFKLLLDQKITWLDLGNKLNNIDIQILGDDCRADFIPFGSSAYFDETKWDLSKEGILSFICNLKNYTKTIEKFFNCLPHITDRVDYLHTKYEMEHEKSTIYDMEWTNKEIERIKKHIAGLTSSEIYKQLKECGL